MTRMVDPTVLKEWLHDGREIALLDVREHGQYGASHLFYGIPLPYSRLELDIVRLVPQRATRIVVYDDGALGVAQRAAARLEELGYTNVHVLREGTRGWSTAGFKLFAGVNVPSKTFGELAEHSYRTPRLKAPDLAAMIEAGDDVVVLDGRPFSEYQKMNIPGSRCCPNAELAYRIQELVPKPDTKIVINCAGRTRSIIGAQTLINLAIPNPVYALENGTQGWYLADLALEHGSQRRYPPVSEKTDLASLSARGRQLANEHGVRFVDDAEVNRWLAEPARTTYLCDVRTAEEFAAGTVCGAVHAPGGQLIQSTDQWIAVRNARIVLIDSDGVRAPVTASWLSQMGYDVSVLRTGISSRVKGAEIDTVALPEIEAVSAAELAAMIASGSATVVDLRASMDYRKAHIPGSLWSIRPQLHDVAKRLRGRVVLVANEPGMAQLAAYDLARAGISEIALLAGGFAAWQALGQPTETTTGIPSDSECIDYLFFVHDRHDGNKEAARQYLAWETNLVELLDVRERSAFRLGTHDAAA